MASLKNDAQDDCDTDVIRARIDNVDALDSDGLDTPVKTICGMPWTINVFKDTDHLAIRLKNERDPDEHWFCCVEVDVMVINAKSKLMSARKTFLHRFHGSSRLETRRIISFEKINKADSGFVHEGCTTIEVRLDVTSRGERNPPRQWNDFSSPSTLTDVVLIIEGEKLHVGKQILAYHSSFFEGLFYANFKESSQDEITLSELDPQDMRILLNIIYDNEEIKEETVEIVMKLADRFVVKNVLIDAEAFMVNSAKMNLDKKLSIACCYNLQNLMDHCMNMMINRVNIMEVKKSEYYDDLPSVIKDELFEKLIQATG